MCVLLLVSLVWNVFLFYNCFKVYEYLSNGSLEDQLSSAHGMPPLLAHTRVHIVKGSASGIVFLNDNNFVHRDIKSANILLDFDFNAKVNCQL